ncbi:MAG: alkaline phosphatase family protein, partial [Chitinophagaceae bacterium]
STLIPEDKRIRIVRDWLELPGENRPHLICLYFNEIDDAGHTYGPDAPETGIAVRKMDAVIGKLVEEVAATGLAVNFILLSDHGMALVDHTKPLGLPREVDTTKFVVPRGDAILQLYAKDRSVIMPTYKALRANANGFKVYLKNELPPRWQIGGRDDRYNRVGDIVLIPEPNLIFNITKNPTDRGKHGYDNNRPDMAACFFAWGPAFKPNTKIRIFDNVHVYPLVARILGLNYDDKIDGKLNVLQSMLR